jgi:prepilin-type N-terminal cleavage/methylation domain-containing protein
MMFQREGQSGKIVWRSSGKGFTLVEMLLVIAIISVLSALVITTVSNAGGDSRRIVARQQQAVLQEALNAWIARTSMGTNGLAGARAAYNGQASAAGKLALLSSYLDSATYSNFSTNSGGALQTEDMKKVGISLTFSTNWTTANYPQVLMQQ